MRRLFLASLVFACAAGAGTFSLEQVLSAPFPYELTASATGGNVAWVLNEHGARNVWVAMAPNYTGVRATSNTEDDGQDVGQLQWTPDGKSVVYTHGGDLEFLDRPDPNPATNPAGVEQAVWVVTPGSAPRKLGDGHSPAVSPKGGLVAFLKEGKIYIVPVAGAEKPALMYYPRSGVTARELAWSPDGSKLAFVSDRVNHSFIAVYDFGAKALTYMEPTVDRDQSPAWSPDSRQVAFVRVPAGGGGRGGRGGGGEGGGWSIRVASVADGTGREIWKSERGQGSAFHPAESEPALLWAAGDRIVFPWEKGGWLHLYSVAVEGGPATLLTPGDFEVDHVAYSADRKEIVFDSNQDDIDRRHVWRVSTASGPARAVTKGDELEMTPVFAGDAIAYLHADGRRPLRAAIRQGETVKDLAPDSIPADFPTDSLVVPQQVIYSASDGLQIHGQLFLPPNSQPGEKHKALVFMHGGSRRQMLLGWHYMDYYNNAYGMNQYLASQGYVVLSINYRSGIGYGLAFREPANYGARGGSEYHDVEGAALYLRTRSDVDPAHIGLWGGSYGGYLTAMGLARGSDLFAAGVDFHGVHDWSSRGNGPGGGASGPPTPSAEAAREESARLAYDSSPIASVSTWKSPVLLIHGDDDRNVNFAETVELVVALRRQGVYFEQLIIPDEIHGFLRHASWLKAYRAEVDFFKRKL
ncbi:MAG: prolyl oligopeptidase family serine peptidase [Bryobacteraceae bacterium]|jgi:dipeptidyl aminopeptidase/acylaminoacyl peptidase